MKRTVDAIFMGYPAREENEKLTAQSQLIQQEQDQVSLMTYSEIFRSFVFWVATAVEVRCDIAEFEQQSRALLEELGFDKLRL